MTRLGIIADTHDNLPKIERAVKFFNKNKVDFVLHAGDFIATFTISKLKCLRCDWCGVFGNNDGEKTGLIKFSEGRIKEGPLRIELAQRKITLVHDINTINPQTEDASLIIFAHTHNPEVSKKDNLLLVNPGECAGWLSARSCVALVDLASLTAKIFRI